MSDARLSAAERRWLETLARDDLAALLAERLRAGRLDPDDVGLAAHCGVEAAGFVLGVSPGPPVHDLDSLRGWTDAVLGRWRRAALRMIVAAHRHDIARRSDTLEKDAEHLVRWTTPRTARDLYRVDPSAPPGAVRDAIRAYLREELQLRDSYLSHLERWILAPDDALALQVTDERLGPRLMNSVVQLLAARGVAWARERLASWDPELWPNYRELMLQETVEVLCSSAPSEVVIGYHRAMCRELAPWAIGESDPVADRVRASAG